MGKTSGWLCLGVDRLLGRGLLLLAAANRRALAALLSPAADIDLLWLHRFGDLAHKVDRQQSILQIRALHLDMVGKREAALERAVGDAAIDEIAVLALILLRLAAGDDEHVLLGGNVDLVGLESRNSKLDAIIVLALLDQVERRIIFLRLAERAVLEHVEQPIEANGGAPERRKVKST